MDGFRCSRQREAKRQGQREKDCAFIDTNHNGQEILVWIIRNGLAVPAGRYGRSGYCSFPEYRFKETLLREIDPKGYEDYIESSAGAGK